MNIYPVRVTARQEPCSRWLWLVKWLLLVPHYVVLFGLWVAFVVLTVVAYVASLCTGRYPAGLYNLLVGGWRWYLRVTAYVALLTDRYPPLRLDQGGQEPSPEPEPDGTPKDGAPKAERQLVDS